MPFTDEDLKKLKEAAKMRGGIVSFEDVRPLIARLEAAEAALNWGHKDGCIFWRDARKSCQCSMEYLKAWRKECSK